MEINDWVNKLSQSGYRVTAPRRGIMEIFLASKQALDPVTIFDTVRQKYPGVGLVTVYRTLDKLEALGLIQRVHQPEGCHMYLRSPQGHEHLLICSRCKSAIYVSGDDLNDLVDKVEQVTGYRVAEHWLQFWGLCPECK